MFVLLLGLVSCHKFEQGMMEDMEVAVSDLSRIRFKVVAGDSSRDVLPTILGNR